MTVAGQPDEPPLVPQGRLEGARTVGTAVFVVTGLLLPAWPFLSFVAIFIFDAPLRGWADELFRYALAGAIWGYPVFWGTGLALWRGALKRGRPAYGLLALPLAPVLWVVLAFAFGS